MFHDRKPGSSQASFSAAERDVHVLVPAGQPRFEVALFISGLRLCDGSIETSSTMKCGAINTSPRTR